MFTNDLVVFVDKIFIGGRNKLYQLTADLNKIAEVNTGPRNEYIDCSFQHCANGANEKSVDNINKVLLIDYDSNRLIACGSFHGSCSTRHLSDITFEQDAIEWVVADTESKFDSISNYLNCNWQKYNKCKKNNTNVFITNEIHFRRIIGGIYCARSIYEECNVCGCYRYRKFKSALRSNAFVA